MRSAWKSLLLLRRAGADRLHQIGRRQDRPPGPEPFDAVGRLPGGLYLSPIAQNAGQRGVVIAVHHLRGVQLAPLVHAHVERRLAAEREAPFGGVEVVRRDAQIGQNTVHGRHPGPTQLSAQKAEIAGHETKTRIIGAVGFGIAVLIERKEPALGAERFEDASRVSAAAERKVDVSPPRVYIEQRHRLFEQDRCMVNGRHRAKICIFGCKVRDFTGNNP